jgi:hypothetical protein
MLKRPMVCYSLPTAARFVNRLVLNLNLPCMCLRCAAAQASLPLDSLYAMSQLHFECLTAGVKFDKQRYSNVISKFKSALDANAPDEAYKKLANVRSGVQHVARAARCLRAPCLGTTSF